MRDMRFMDVRVGGGCEITELFVSDIAMNMGVPGGNYVPAVSIMIRTKDGRAYRGLVYFEDLIEALKKVESSALTKLLKKCQVDT